MVTDSITYAAKYKIDTNLLLIDGSVSEFKAGNLLPGEVQVHRHPSAILSPNLPRNLQNSQSLFFSGVLPLLYLLM